jgi:RHS repeat-associated protein
MRSRFLAFVLVGSSIGFVRTVAASDSAAPLYTKDSRGRIETVTTAQGTTRYAYYDDGILSEVQYPDGTRDTFDHEAVLEGRRVASEFAASLVEAGGDPDTVARTNRFAFTGHIYDRETGLYFAGARFYDPQIGRFITQDSFLGRAEVPPSLHRYAYGHANPTRFVDPTGHEALQLYMRYSGVDDPAHAAKMRRAENRALGSIVGTGQFVAGVALGLVRSAGHLAAGAFGYQPSIEAGKEFLDQTQAFLEHPIDNTTRAYNEALDRAQAQMDAGKDFQAGRDFTRDVTAPIASTVAGGIEAGLRSAGRVRYLAKRPHTPSPPQVVPIQEALASGGEFVVTEEGAVMASRRVAGGSQGADALLDATRATATRAERLAGPKLEHMNASVAEIRGYQNLLDRGFHGIRGPGKTAARGADSIAYDPTTAEIVVQDAKYRGPAGKYPSRIPASKLKRWGPDIQRAIEALPDGPLKDAARQALESGQVRPEVFRWPQ